MQIISHRGYWKNFLCEANRKEAFCRSFDLGFGTETDLRDFCGEVVISHDVAKGGEITFSCLLEIMAGRNLPLALNIKADGLCDAILKTLQDFNQTNYFTFDMSLPEMVFQSERNVKFFTGMSDIQKTPPLLQKASGVWLDSFFEAGWFSKSTVEALLDQGKKVCIVSEDLHFRNTDFQWQMIKDFSFLNCEQIFLCTNFPEKAKNFFEVTQ